MYAAVNTRPDVTFATGQLARVVQCPNEEQVAAGRRVAKYLGQTPTVGLHYSAAAQRRQKGADGVQPGRLFLTAFSDASYASEPEDMTSVGGFICCVCGGPTAWESKMQVDQALSSVESEYMALFRAVWEIVWQRRLLAELGEEQQGPTPLYYDSKGAIALAKNPVLHGLTKHLRFYHLTSRRVLSSQDVTFDESVSYYLIFPYRTSSPPPPSLFLSPGTPPVDPLPPQGRARSGVSQVDPAEPVEEAVDSGAESGGAEPAGAGTRGAAFGGAEPGHVEPVGTVSGGAEPARAASGGALGVPARRKPLSPQQLREWYSRRCRGPAEASGGAAGASRGAAGAGAAGGSARASGGAAGSGAAGGVAGARAAGGSVGAGATGGAGGTAGAGAAGDAAGTGDPWAEGTGSVSAYGGAVQARPYYRCELESRPVSPESRFALPIHPVRAGRVSRLCPPPVPGTHSMTLRPCSVPQRVPLPSPPASSLPAGPDPASDSLHAASPAVMRFLATAVTDPLFESTAASALVTELVDFAAA
ncbi:unnamed protein product [Closterium sp. NIES-53]